MTPIEQKGWKKFINACITLQNKKECETFMHMFLTIEEQRALSIRIQIIEELLKGNLTQREIAKKLETSVAKITRGSNYIKTLNHSQRTYLERILL